MTGSAPIPRLSAKKDGRPKIIFRALIPDLPEDLAQSLEKFSHMGAKRTSIAVVDL